MKIIRNVEELKKFSYKLKKDKVTTSFVPTMGALHEGHLSLIDTAKQNSDFVIASIFVNPSQFAANEDLDTYPKQEKADIAVLEKYNVDLLFIPKREDIYTDNFSTTISLGNITKILEGVTRPHFFNGVAIIVLKLFNLTSADIAVFGEKDYQQLLVIKKLVHDLNLPIEILSAPVKRETDGLAMSSRNLNLNSKTRKIAPKLYESLITIAKNKNDIENAITNEKLNLIKSGFDKIDYITLADAKTLKPLKHATNSCRLLAAAHLGKVRIIDNIAL